MSWASNHPSDGGLSLGFSLNGRDKSSDDELKLRKYLLDRGYPDDAVDYLVQKSKQTGKVETALPNFQNELQSGNQANRPVALPPVTDIPERSTLQNFNPMEHDSIATLDIQHPNQLNFLPVPRGTNVRSVVETDKPQRPEKEPPDPEKVLAANELKIFQKKAGARDANGNPYEFTSDEIMRVQNAADTLGIPYTPGQEKSQGWWQKFTGATPQMTPPMLFKAQGIDDKASQWLQQNGLPDTPRNRAHAIKTGRVK